MANTRAAAYELFWGSGGHSGPYHGMDKAMAHIRAVWKSGTETHIHVHRRDAAGLGGYWYIGSYRLKWNGLRIWPKPYPEWWIGRDRDWNRRPQKAPDGPSLGEGKETTPTT